MTKTSGKSTRITAQERREDILAAAITEFSEKGLHGASTVTIAERVGISHPNLFRLFPTKKELFVAAIERVLERIEREMIANGKANPEAPLEAMRESWHNMLTNRELMLMLLQGYAACYDPEVQTVMRRGSMEIFSYIEEMPGVNTDQARVFYAEGMHLMIAAAMNLPELASHEDKWARKFIGF